MLWRDFCGVGLELEVELELELMIPCWWGSIDNL